jgi:hypothetical protein
VTISEREPPLCEQVFSAIDILAVPNAKGKHNQAVVLNFADNAVIPRPVSSILSEAGAAERLSDFAGIFLTGYSFVKKIQNPPRVLWVELAEVAPSVIGLFNRPCHNSS